MLEPLLFLDDDHLFTSRSTVELNCIQSGLKVMLPLNNIIFYYRRLTRARRVWKRGLG